MQSFLLAVAGGIATIAILAYIITPYMNRLIRNEAPERIMISLAMIILFAFAALNEATQLHAAIGAFLTGLLLPDKIRHLSQDRMDVPVTLLLPFLFLDRAQDEFQLQRELGVAARLDRHDRLRRRQVPWRHGAGLWQRREPAVFHDPRRAHAMQGTDGNRRRHDPLSEGRVRPDHVLCPHSRTSDRLVASWSIPIVGFHIRARVRCRSRRLVAGRLGLEHTRANFARAATQRRRLQSQQLAGTFIPLSCCKTIRRLGGWRRQ